MGDVYLATTKATYYPPALMPGYMGRFIPVKHGYDNSSEGGNVNYFQEQRNEGLPGSTEWGVSNTPYTPRPDLVAVEKLVNTRRLLQKRQMPLSLVVTDPVRRQEVDDFYVAAQLHRDQYRDHTGKLHPLVYFKNPELTWKCPPDFMKIYMKCPQYYVKYRHPLVLPKTLSRTFPCPPLPDRSLVGRRYRHSDYAYKR